MGSALQNFRPDPNLSEVKNLILKKLWSGEWVSSQALLRLTKQKYFDRRIREMRDQEGWDIETGMKGGTAAYRLVSKERGERNPRYYLNSTQKARVLERDGPTCRICGYKGKQGESRLQFDHKVPLIRRGSIELTNIQILCTGCNVSKRGVCADCKLRSCEGCSYAYPEKVERMIPLGLSPGTLQALSQKAYEMGADIVSVAREAVEEYVKKPK